ncbi:MAG TPA: uracil-DNA glycosylase family protein, partial [Myxococcaceae bacterium]|nr:uracil-DNA glycosylase family protein [Myxococcaceae bacterium]
MSRIFLIGQAPGNHEVRLGRPFAWTAGRTLFSWFESALGVDEETFRRTVYMAAVVRCFPGKAKGGGDRRPAPDEIDRCRRFLEREVALLRPRLLLPVGTL